MIGITIFKAILEFSLLKTANISTQILHLFCIWIEAPVSVSQYPATTTADTEIHDPVLTLFLTCVHTSCYCFSLLLSKVPANVNVTGSHGTTFICIANPHYSYCGCISVWLSVGLSLLWLLSHVEPSGQQPPCQAHRPIRREKGLQQPIRT